MIEFRALGSIELVHADGHAIASVLAQPKRLALLAYLAIAAPRRFQRRDALLALFWPESDAERARGALRQAVRFLRRSLGENALVNRGEDEIELNTDAVHCDVVEFDSRIAAGDDAAAVALYRGDLLDGFFIADAPAWEHWVDGERLRLRRAAAAAAARLAARAAEAGGLDEAVAYARRACALAPTDEPAVRLVISLLARAGDRAGAMAEYERLAALLAAEYEVQPDPETVRLIERVRAGSGPSGGSPAASALPLPIGAAAPAEDLHADPVTPARSGAPGSPRAAAAARGLLWWLPAAALLLLMTTAAAWYSWPRTPGVALHPERFLVAPLENLTGDSMLAPLGQMAADWISQGIAGVAGVEVVPTMTLLSSARHLQLDREALGQPDRLALLAREVGAGRLISGSYYLQEGRLLVQARISDVASGGVLHAIEPIEAAAGSPLIAVEALRTRIRAALGPLVDQSTNARAATAPPTYEAYRDYVAGMEAFVRNDMETALHHFQRSAAADSGYPMPLIVTAIAHLNLGNLEAADSVTRQVNLLRERLGPMELATHDMVRAWLRGDNAAAYSAVVRQTQLAPGTIAHYQVAEQARRLNRPREALRVLRELSPDGSGPRGELRGFPSYWREAAWSHHMLGQHRAELKSARRARQLFPDHPDMMLYEARALAALRRVADVERLVQQRLAGVPETQPSPGAFMQLAALELRAHGEHDAAARLLERSADWYASRPPQIRQRYRFAHAAALYTAGRFEESRLIFEEVVAEFPQSMGARAHLGLLAARRGDRLEAERVAAWLEELERPFMLGDNTWWRALIAAQLNDQLLAVQLLGQALSEGLQYGPWLHTAIDLEPLRAFGPYRELLRPKG